jgi:hypothetical protein
MGRSFFFIDDETLICEDIDYVKTYKILVQETMLEISKGKLINLEGKTHAKSLIGVTPNGIVLAYSASNYHIYSYDHNVDSEFQN